LANELCRVRAFIKEDLPTFDLPIKAYSGRGWLGQSSTDELLITNLAE
jgi:hypothetical protein